ncbi:hypothetical protein GCM10011594_32640 [Nakamurella endophytica]|uniref:Uncharacterized protein n=1 Tax=Nakamurella endophytica TaxID=1748367 RepID=A0A917WJT0_9ACTN|nr:hypothetical protein GCM10011594_32640 [Nakamurella endophytica]
MRTQPHPAAPAYPAARSAAAYAHSRPQPAPVTTAGATTYAHPPVKRAAGPTPAATCTHHQEPPVTCS